MFKKEDIDEPKDISRDVSDDAMVPWADQDNSVILDENLIFESLTKPFIRHQIQVMRPTWVEGELLIELGEREVVGVHHLLTDLLGYLKEHQNIKWNNTRDLLNDVGAIRGGGPVDLDEGWTF